MAIPWSRSLLAPFMFLLTSILMLSFLNCFSLAYSNDDDLIHQICSETINPPLCLRSFKEYPESPTADLKTLGRISIDFSTARANSSYHLVEMLKQNATEEILLGIYETCLENYGDTIDDLGDCYGLLNSGDYLSLNIRASAAMTCPVTCDDSFEEAKFSEPQQLKDASDTVQDSCNVLLVIAKRLQGGELLIIHGSKGTHES